MPDDARAVTLPGINEMFPGASHFVVGKRSGGSLGRRTYDAQLVHTLLLLLPVLAVPCLGFAKQHCAGKSASSYAASHPRAQPRLIHLPSRPRSFLSSPFLLNNTPGATPYLPRAARAQRHTHARPSASTSRTPPPLRRHTSTNTSTRRRPTPISPPTPLSTRVRV